jgi:hypothetical protein
MRLKNMKKLIPALTLVALALPYAGAQAVDLPPRKAAPIEYVRVCDAYGAGFFFIPGTDTCLRVGGSVVGEYRGYSSSYRMNRNIIGSNNVFGFNTIPTLAGPRTVAGFLPQLLYSNERSSDNSEFDAIGRVDLDARTSTPLGALRTFIRVESFFASGTSAAAAGALAGPELFGGANFGNGTVFNTPARETTILNKAFVQLAGLTAGRAQSFFDFYVDDVNWEVLRGSNATVGAFAYTYTFSDGFSGSFSVEDNVSRRGIIGSTIGEFNLAGSQNPAVAAAAAQAFGTRFFGVPDGAQVPELVANLRWDQPWGAVQVSGAAHQIRTSLYANNAVLANIANNAPGVGLATAIPAHTQDDYGFAVQAGARLNLDKLAPEVFSAGDKLWVQAVYERGAVGYVMGSNLSFNGGPVNGNTFYGFGNGGTKAGNGWNFNAYDCVWTVAGHCDKSDGWAVTAAMKHYWTPTISSGIFGSYMALYYSRGAIADLGRGVGAVNTDEYRVGSNLVWTPVKNFDIGGEIMYLRDNHHSRPVGLAPDFALLAIGLPSYRGSNGTVEGRLRVQRTF